MRLKAEDRKRQLMAAAMRLFSTQGFDATTTIQIAREAGVNEALIFRHFKSKEDLYWAVVTNRVQAIGRRRRILEHLQDGRDARETLAMIAGSLLDRTKDDAALTRLLFFSALRNQKLADEFFRTYMRGTFEVLADYFRGQVRKGLFRRMDPLIAARGFLGTVIYHYLVQEVFGGEHYHRFDPHVVGREITDLWLDGILAKRPANGNNVNGKRHANGSRAKETKTKMVGVRADVSGKGDPQRFRRNGFSKGSTN